MRSLFDATYTPEAVLSYQKNTKQSVIRLKLSPPPSQAHAHTYTHSMHATHTSAQRHVREHFHTQAHTRVQVWPASPSSTHLPSLCLFMVSLILIPSHSISFTSASSLHSFATTVFFSCPCILLLHTISPVTGIVSNNGHMYINQRCQELLHMQHALTVNKE